MSSFVLTPIPASSGPPSYMLNGLALLGTGNHFSDRRVSISPLVRPWLVTPDGSDLIDLMFDTRAFLTAADNPSFMWDSGIVARTDLTISGVPNDFWFEHFRMDTLETYYSNDQDVDAMEDLLEGLILERFYDFYGIPAGSTSIPFVSFNSCDPDELGTEFSGQLRFLVNPPGRNSMSYRDQFNIADEDISTYGKHPLPTPGEMWYQMLTLSYIMGNDVIITNFMDDPSECLGIHCSGYGVSFYDSFYFLESKYTGDPERYLNDLLDLSDGEKFSEALNIIRSI